MIYSHDGPSLFWFGPFVGRWSAQPFILIYLLSSLGPRIWPQGSRKDTKTGVEVDIEVASIKQIPISDLRYGLIARKKVTYASHRKSTLGAMCFLLTCGQYTVSNIEWFMCYIKKRPLFSSLSFLLHIWKVWATSPVLFEYFRYRSPTELKAERKQAASPEILSSRFFYDISSKSNLKSFQIWSKCDCVIIWLYRHVCDRQFSFRLYPFCFKIQKQSLAYRIKMSLLLIQQKILCCDLRTPRNLDLSRFNKNLTLKCKNN